MTITELFQSIGNWFKERTTNPLYVAFIISVIIWNWKFFFILFFQNEEYLLQPKIEYLDLYFNSLNCTYNLPHWISFLLFPAISTFVIIWVLPYFNNFAYKTYLKFHYQREAIKDAEKITYERKKEGSLIEISKLKESQVDIKRDIEKNTTEEDRWIQEYESIKNKPLFKEMNKLKSVIYEHSGNTYYYNGAAGQYLLRIPADVLAVADSRGLIRISGVNHDQKIEPTEKGKFFIDRFLNGD